MRISILALALMACGSKNFVVAEMSADDIAKYCAGSEIDPNAEEVECDDGSTVTAEGQTEAECATGIEALQDAECDITTDEIDACNAAGDADPCGFFEAPECEKFFACFFG